MKLYIKSANNQKLEAGQQVNRIGKYLYKHLDSAFKMEKSVNTCDVYFTLYYQIPYLQRRPGKGERNEVEEMVIDLSITTYQNKVRVNILEVTPDERTLGFKAWKPELLQDLELSQTMILDEVKKKVEKAYQDFDFIY